VLHYAPHHEDESGSGSTAPQSEPQNQIEANVHLHATVIYGLFNDTVSSSDHRAEW
jgi:hypothetical protein